MADGEQPPLLIQYGTMTAIGASPTVRLDNTTYSCPVYGASPDLNLTTNSYITGSRVMVALVDRKVFLLCIVSTPAPTTPPTITLTGLTVTGNTTVNSVNMSGTLNYTGSAMGIKMQDSGAHIYWYNGATPTGYLQGLGSSGLILNSAAGVLDLRGNPSIHLNAQHQLTFDQYRLTTTPDAFTTFSVSLGEFYSMAGVVALSSTLTIGGAGNIQFKDTTTATINTRWGYIDNNGFSADGTRYFAFPTYGGGWFMNDSTWIRAVGNKAVYTLGRIRADSGFQSGAGWWMAHYNDTDTGIYYDSDGAWRLVSNNANSLAMGSQGVATPHLYLNGFDPNHGMFYQSAVDGPEIDGYSCIRLWVVNGGKNFELRSDGNAYAVSGIWTPTSSIKVKENIVDLSTEQALNMVHSLRPVTYDRINGGKNQVGLIAEWTRSVAPQLVVGDDDMLGVDYGGLGPVLTRVMQQVLDRLDAIEAKLNN